MISNTVVVLLRDLLPLFILFSYLSALQTFRTQWRNGLQLTAISACVSVSLFYFSFEYITESADGTGYEILSSVMLMIFWLSAATATIFHPHLPQTRVNALVVIGSGLLITLKTTEFLIYFGVLVQNSANILAVVLGFLMGIAICISFYLLFRFFLTELLSKNKQKVAYLLWFTFLTGQVVQIPERLSQINLINLGSPVFQLGNIVQDSSEYGHVLHVLTGYESSPSFAYLCLYGSCMLVLTLAGALSSRIPAPPSSLLSSEVLK